MHEIQKDIPLPKAVRSTAATRRLYPFEDMAVGEMFFVPNRDKNNLTTHASTVGKKLGRKFATRLVYMTDVSGEWETCDKEAKGAVQGIGVWRTK